MASLVANYGDSSDESSVDSEAENIEETKQRPTTNSRLPPPAFADKIKNSVFINPFLEAENAQFAVLEKHVKMVPQSNGREQKKICWMFKKGNCRFGKKCKFLHHEEPTGTPSESDQAVTILAEGTEGEAVVDQLEDEEEEAVPKKRKRPGLTQGLVPGKRIMSMYRKQREYSH